MNKKVTFVPPSMEAPDGITLKHLAPSIGTEILGVDLRQPLTDDLSKFIHTTLLERKVVFFRDQDISPEEHLAFGRHWGELEVIPFLEHDDTHPELLTIRRGADDRSYENTWHSDVSWRAEPSMGSILRAIKVPAVGGDTLWCDMVAVYNALSPSMKAMLEGREAVHSIEGLVAYTDRETIEKYLVEFPPQTHPIVRTHPETGEKVLYVGGHIRRIKGLATDESELLLRQLGGYAAIPEFQCRFRWEANSIAFWDNRSTQHYAVYDYAPQERFMDRVTIKGDRPV